MYSMGAIRLQNNAPTVCNDFGGLQVSQWARTEVLPCPETQTFSFWGGLRKKMVYLPPPPVGMRLQPSGPRDILSLWALAQIDCFHWWMYLNATSGGNPRCRAQDPAARWGSQQKGVHFLLSCAALATGRPRAPPPRPFRCDLRLGPITSPWPCPLLL